MVIIIEGGKIYVRVRPEVYPQLHIGYPLLVGPFHTPKQGVLAMVLPRIIQPLVAYSNRYQYELQSPLRKEPFKHTMAPNRVGNCRQGWLFSLNVSQAKAEKTAFTSGCQVTVELTIMIFRTLSDLYLSLLCSGITEQVPPVPRDFIKMASTANMGPIRRPPF